MAEAQGALHPPPDLVPTRGIASATRRAAKSQAGREEIRGARHVPTPATASEAWWIDAREVLVRTPGSRAGAGWMVATRIGVHGRPVEGVLPRIAVVLTDALTIGRSEAAVEVPPPGGKPPPGAVAALVESVRVVGLIPPARPEPTVEGATGSSDREGAGTLPEAGRGRNAAAMGPQRVPAVVAVCPRAAGRWASAAATGVRQEVATAARDSGTAQRATERVTLVAVRPAAVGLRWRSASRCIPAWSPVRTNRRHRPTSTWTCCRAASRLNCAA